MTSARGCALAHPRGGLLSSWAGIHRIPAQLRERAPFWISSPRSFSPPLGFIAPLVLTPATVRLVFMARRIDTADGMRLLALAHHRGVDSLSKADMKMAGRFALEEIAERHPGHSVEVRVPFCGAVQIGEGPAHRRGTPPNVVEMALTTWLGLCIGTRRWEEAQVSGSVDASGIRADLAEFLPLFSEATLNRW